MHIRGEEEKKSRLLQPGPYGKLASSKVGASEFIRRTGMTRSDACLQHLNQRSRKEFRKVLICVNSFACEGELHTVLYGTSHGYNLGSISWYSCPAGWPDQFNE